MKKGKWVARRALYLAVTHPPQFHLRTVFIIYQIQIRLHMMDPNASRDCICPSETGENPKGFLNSQNRVCNKKVHDLIQLRVEIL